MDLMTSEELFFSQLRGLPDGLEGSLTQRSRDKLLKWSLGRYGGDLDVARQEVEQYEKHSDAFFVNCWHMNNAESYLMWKV